MLAYIIIPVRKFRIHAVVWTKLIPLFDCENKIVQKRISHFYQDDSIMNLYKMSALTLSSHDGVYVLYGTYT